MPEMTFQPAAVVDDPQLKYFGEARAEPVAGQRTHYATNRNRQCGAPRLFCFELIQGVMT